MAKKKKVNSVKKEKNTNWTIIVRNVIILGILVLLGYLFLRYYISPTKSSQPVTEQMILQRTWDNYYLTVDSVAKSFEINPSYLLALMVLECSGRKEFEPRFEEKVYNQLRYARDHNKSFGSIKNDQIADANDDAIRNLATSWGPFQLMGYQVIQLGVSVQDIRGEHNVYWGTYWVYKRYSKYLKKKKYKDCFHIHNTGKPTPLIGDYQTYDKSYVPRGLAYMEYFEKKIKEHAMSKI